MGNLTPSLDGCTSRTSASRDLESPAMLRICATCFTFMSRSCCLVAIASSEDTTDLMSFARPWTLPTRCSYRIFASSRPLMSTGASPLPPLPMAPRISTPACRRMFFTSPAMASRFLLFYFVNTRWSLPATHSAAAFADCSRLWIPRESVLMVLSTRSTHTEQPHE